MFSDYTSPFSQKRDCVYYVPWLSLISFLLVLAGTITWGVGTSAAMKNMNLMVDALRINFELQLNTAQVVAVLIIAGCCVLAAGMLAMSSGRSCTEYAVDKRGAPTRGSRFWLGFSAVVTVLWWMVLVLLMFVFFVCILWYSLQQLEHLQDLHIITRVNKPWFGLMFVVTSVLDVIVETADDFVSWGIEYHNVTKAILEAQLGPLPDYIDTNTCPPNCLDLDIAAYFIGREACICGAGVMASAYAYAVKASSATVAVAARRERALLLRVQRALAASGGGFTGAAGVLSSDAPQQPVAAPAGGPGIELTAATYGVQPKYGEGIYADVDKVPLLKNPQQAYPQPYQEQFQQPYQRPQEQYQYQDRPAVVVVQQSDVPADSQGRQPGQVVEPSRAELAWVGTDYFLMELAVLKGAREGPEASGN
ncbi:hypothetical protein VOLCADRAFT_102706 [Volvox carteri f. nagariensis]|uniref:Uncharacterized protein n=1 Tax=Volvox carteri f. nagariensis TaxID=3068 RepID=D8THK3_VOLCA|nr:uncharacterized protein VOLCADRAFT_102706 [Volvox carteri f. nagariensis]EFJ53085.1 hypothetical protein VOLCADRAFT_102706 [Volvox carteri f. nagariensis]|eukprot:XP_002946090.1 hypothetical protein VOLCADRAFT_102706 [Volvox carteri f. nagariensis]